jgi:hypothetical protein
MGGEPEVGNEEEEANEEDEDAFVESLCWGARNVAQAERGDYD